MKALNTIVITTLSAAATWFATKVFYKNTEKEIEERTMKTDHNFISELREKVLNAKSDLDVEKVRHFQATSALKIENQSLKEEVERLRKILKATQQKAYELSTREVNNV